MDLWREKASEMFPELTSRFEAVDSPYDLWVELWLAFEDAHPVQIRILYRAKYLFIRECIGKTVSTKEEGVFSQIKIEQIRVNGNRTDDPVHNVSVRVQSQFFPVMSPRSKSPWTKEWSFVI